MTIVPVELYGVLAHGLSREGLGSRLEHRQGPGRQLQGITRLPPAFAALFFAQGARAGIPQVRERILGAVAVLPLDSHPGSSSEIHLDRLRVRGGTRRFQRRLHDFSIACIPNLDVPAHLRVTSDRASLAGKLFVSLWARGVKRTQHPATVADAGRIWSRPVPNQERAREYGDNHPVKKQLDHLFARLILALLQGAVSTRRERSRDRGRCSPPSEAQQLGQTRSNPV